MAAGTGGPGPANFRLDVRTALVTGSVRGLGPERARGPAGAGARVVLRGRTRSRWRRSPRGCAKVPGRHGADRQRWPRIRTAPGRRGRPEEIAGIVVLLAGDAASFSTGQTIAVGVG